MTTDTNQRILEFIKQNNRVRPVDLVRSFGFTQAAIHRQLNKLLAKKLIEKIGTPPKVFYQLPVVNLDKQLALALAKNKNIISSYILGSYNAGTATTGSDFDLAVVVDKKIPDDQIYKLIRTIKFPKDLDLSIVDKSSSPLFLFQIVKTGKRIFERSAGEAIAFEDFSLHNYYDTQHIRNLNYLYLKQKFLYAD